MARARFIETSITLRDLDWVVCGTYSGGSRPYWDRSIGVMLPGDDPEVTIDRIEGDGHAAELDEDDLTAAERDTVEEAIACAAEDA